MQILHLSPTLEARSNRNGLKCNESYSYRQVAQGLKSGRKSSSIIGFFTHFWSSHFWVTFTHLRSSKKLRSKKYSVQVLHLSPTLEARSNRNGLKCNESYWYRQVAHNLESGRKSSSIIGFFTHFWSSHFWVMFCRLGNDFVGDKKVETRRAVWTFYLFLSRPRSLIL